MGLECRSVCNRSALTFPKDCFPTFTAASASFALCVGALALASDCCAHFFPAPERSLMDDHATGYLSLPDSALERFREAAGEDGRQ